MPHVDLRVVRKVNYQAIPDGGEWETAINKFGSDNRNLGVGVSLGAAAMTYIPAKHMNSMLAEQYPRDYGDRKSKVGLFRRINASLKAYMEVEETKARYAQTDMVATIHEERLSDWRTQMVDDIFDEIGRPATVIPPASLTELTSDELAQLDTYRFGPATFAVRGLALFYGCNYGLDLSGEELPYHERRGLIDHLRNEEDLPVHILDPGWKPHATILRVHDHLKPPDNLPLKVDLPYQLAFLPPSTENYGLDGAVTGK